MKEIPSISDLLNATESLRASGDQLRRVEKERQKTLMQFMDHLRDSNADGMPPLYVCANSRRNRVVIATTPLVDDQENRASYLLVAKSGFFSLDVVLDKDVELGDLQNPLLKSVKERNENGITIVLASIHNGLRGYAVSGRKLDYAFEITRDLHGEPFIDSRNVFATRIALYSELSELTSVEFAESFSKIHEINIQAYQKKSEWNREITRQASKLLGTEKPKRG